MKNAWRTLRLHVEDRVGYLTLDSGGRFNILHRACLIEIKATLAAFEADPQVVCIVLSGGAGESFAVGADIAEMKDFGPLDGLAFAELAQSLFARMEASAKPIIGALNGVTMGGGCDLALACDLRLASDRLKIAHPGARLGIVTGFGGTQKLPRLIGRSQALEIFMTAEAYAADEALRLGLVDRVFPCEAFWPEVKAFALRIAAMAPEALAAAKQLINAAADGAPNNVRSLESGAFSTLFSASARRGFS